MDPQASIDMSARLLAVVDKPASELSASIAFGRLLRGRWRALVEARILEQDDEFASEHPAAERERSAVEYAQKSAAADAKTLEAVGWALALTHFVPSPPQPSVCAEIDGVLERIVLDALREAPPASTASLSCQLVAELAVCSVALRETLLERLAQVTSSHGADVSEGILSELVQRWTRLCCLDADCPRDLRFTNPDAARMQLRAQAVPPSREAAVGALAKVAASPVAAVVFRTLDTQRSWAP